MNVKRVKSAIAQPTLICHFLFLFSVSERIIIDAPTHKRNVTICQNGTLSPAEETTSPSEETTAPVIDSVANRFKNRGLKVIDVSDPIPGLPIVVRADTSPRLIESIKKALLSLDYNNPEHRKMMERWDEEFRYGFVEATDSDYDAIREMINYMGKKGIKIP